MADTQTINIRPPLWLPILAVVIGGAFYVAGKNIEKRPVAATPGIISVSGEGKVTVTPDIAMISFGMQTGRMDTAKAAMTKLSTGMNKVFDAVKQSGVEEKDITTEQFSLIPVYDWTDGGQVFRGFEASQSLRVKVRDLDKVTDVLGAATAAGANQAGNVNFTVDNPEAKQAEARQKAIDQAKEKAKTLAAQLGVQLGDIQNFSEGGGGYPSPVMMRSEYGMGGGVADQKSIPLPSGEQDVTAYVTITYELE